MNAEPVTLQVTLEINVDPETHAAELREVLDALRFGLVHRPGWRGKVRRVQVVVR